MVTSARSVKQELIDRAVEEYGEVRPCGSRRDLIECFTVESDRICFWFNTGDGSTHVMSADV